MAYPVQYWIQNASLREPFSVILAYTKHFSDSLSLEIKEGPHDIQVNWGGTAIFTCKIQGPSASIIWMRGDKELTPDNEKYKMMDDGSLMIQNTSETDGGYYECMAKNDEDEVKSRPARMIVLAPTEYTTQGYGKVVLYRFFIGI